MKRMTPKQICRDGSIFWFIGIASAAFAIVPVYFLGKRAVMQQSIPLDTPERIILYTSLVWLSASILLSFLKRESFLMPDGTLAIRFALCGISFKTINLGDANKCELSIDQNTVRFRIETRDCVNIIGFSSKDYRSHVLGSYLSTEEAESDLAQLKESIKQLSCKR
jgi:hypothetical protein